MSGIQTCGFSEVLVGFLTLQSLMRLKSILCLQYLIWREHGEAVMTPPACSKQDENKLEELRFPDCM